MSMHAEADVLAAGYFPRRVSRRRTAVRTSTEARQPVPVLRAVQPLLAAAGALVAAAVFLPLWGMTLVSTQYPEGLRMVIYPTRIVGDITEINVLNHYIGMAEITNAYFVELSILPLLFATIATACLAASMVRHPWATAMPLLMMGGTAAYGFWSMKRRLYQFGHELDPAAPIDIEPFTPRMLGEHTLAQFATYSYFDWGTFLPMLAGALAGAALWLQLRALRTPNQTPREVTMRRASFFSALLLGALLSIGGCGKGQQPATSESKSAVKPTGPTAGDQEFARLTAKWTQGALDGCGSQLRDVLGTRDLVQGVLDGVADPSKAKDEVEDARGWIRKGDQKFQELKPKLETGACDGTVTVGLDETWQFYVKAGTSAVQAGQIAGA